MSDLNLIATVFLAGIVAGVFIIYLGLRQRTLQLEMRHRERLAMIEKGHIPLESAHRPAARGGPGHRTPGGRSVSVGIIVVGFGLALAIAIGFAGGSPGPGVGVGGAIAVLGGAFIIRGIVVRGEHPGGAEAPFDSEPHDPAA